MSTRTNHDGADEQTWYAVIVDERYCLDSLNVDDALAEARRIAAANPRLSCRLVSFPVPRGRDPETTAYRLGVTDPNWGALWKNETTQPRTATAREPDATAPSSSRNGPWLLVGAAALIAVGVAALTFVGSSHRPSPSQPSTPSVSMTKVPTATAPDATTATATKTVTSRETAAATPQSTPPATASAAASSEATTPSATDTTAPSPSSEGQSR